MKGMYVRKQMAQGNQERFADPSHGEKVDEKRLHRLHRGLSMAAKELGSHSDLFKALDRNHDKRITIDELKRTVRAEPIYLQETGPKRVADADLEYFFRTHDRDMSGTIEVSELVDFLQMPVDTGVAQRVVRRSQTMPAAKAAAMSDDEAAARISAGMKGMYVRKQMAQGNQERFADPSHGDKVGGKRLHRLHRGLNDAAYRMGARGSDYSKLFRALDKNHDKRITIEELKRAVRSAPIELLTEGSKGVPDADLEHFFIAYDEDLSGTIEVSELVDFLKQPIHMIGQGKRPISRSASMPAPKAAAMSDDDDRDEFGGLFA
jgi:Ca2+-binding EF-hand superfamily protein